MSTGAHFKILAASNNGHTLHFQKLLVHVLRLVRKVHASPARAPAATNALYLTRTVVCHLTETQVCAAAASVCVIRVQLQHLIDAPL